MTEEARRVLACVKRWLTIRERWEDRSRPFTNGLQLCADIDHSSLLQRLLDGKEPLPEPPPRAHSYPWYELVEQGAGWAREVWWSDALKMLVVAQSPQWELVEAVDANTYRARYRPDGPIYRITRGALPVTSLLDPPPVVEGWHLEREA